MVLTLTCRLKVVLSGRVRLFALSLKGVSTDDGELFHIHISADGRFEVGRYPMVDSIGHVTLAIIRQPCP
jgi:hypothetical protein